jgi:protein-disulfide isomerase
LEIPPGELSVAGALLARCAGKDRYFAVLDAIFHAQAAMVDSGAVRAGLLEIARSAGMSDGQFEACVSDGAAIKALDDRSRIFSVHEHVSGVPTFVVNGLRLEGNQTLEQLEAAIDGVPGGSARR